MENEFNYPSTAELMVLIAKSQFLPFTKADWYSFAGCESENPLICEAEEYTIIIDGNNVNMVYHEDEYGGEAYSLQEGF
jgi:hypothetical protein